MAQGKFMSEMHLRQPGFAYSACGPFTKNKTIQKFKATGDSRYRNELNKACFQHDMAYVDLKTCQEEWHLTKYCDKTFKIASNPKYDGYHELASLVYKCSDKAGDTSPRIETVISESQELASKLASPSENLKGVKCTHLIIELGFGVLVLQTC